MLQEDELSLSNHEESPQDEKDVSLIQNRVPSPLNNNFLLSAEQYRHLRQPSNDLNLQRDFFEIGEQLGEEDEEGLEN